MIAKEIFWMKVLLRIKWKSHSIWQVKMRIKAWKQIWNFAKNVKLTNPGSVQKNAYKHWWNGKVVNKWTNLEHEVKFVIRRNELKNKF